MHFPYHIYMDYDKWNVYSQILCDIWTQSNSKCAKVFIPWADLANRKWLCLGGTIATMELWSELW